MTAPDPRLGEIEERLSKATPGPWEIIGGNEYLTGIDVCIGSWDEGGISLNDAEFIAAAPADVAYLLAELRKAQDALGRVEGPCQCCGSSYGSHEECGSPYPPSVAVAAATGGES